MRDHPLYKCMLKRRLRGGHVDRVIYRQLHTSGTENGPVDVKACWQDARRTVERELDEWWDELGEPCCDPVGYMGSHELAKECKKFFTKYHWYYLSQMTMERYRGFTCEEGMRLCMDSYARYLLRGFAAHPRWTEHTAQMAAKVPEEERVAKAYFIYGYKEQTDEDEDEFPVEGADPVEGYMVPQSVLRNGKRRSNGMMMPVYPGIETHGDL